MKFQPCEWKFKSTMITGAIKEKRKRKTKNLVIQCIETRLCGKVWLKIEERGGASSHCFHPFSLCVDCYNDFLCKRLEGFVFTTLTVFQAKQTGHIGIYQTS